MKTSLKALRPTAEAPAPAPAPAAATPEAPGYKVPQTRLDTRQLSGHYPAEDVKAFRVLAATQDMDVQELLAEALNMVFERYGLPNRIEITSGRRKRA